MMARGSPWPSSLGDTLVTETLIERLSQKAADLIASKPVLPPRDFPLVLRPAWRIDNNPRIGRLRALAAVAMKRKTARPASYTVAE